MINDSNNLLNFQDPGALDDELLNVPGFINELTDPTFSPSTPQPLTTFRRAIPIAAVGIAGR